MSPSQSPRRRWSPGSNGGRGGGTAGGQESSPGLKSPLVTTKNWAETQSPTFVYKGDQGARELYNLSTPSLRQCTLPPENTNQTQPVCAGLLALQPTSSDVTALTHLTWRPPRQGSHPRQPCGQAGHACVYRKAICLHFLHVVTHSLPPPRP
jgi:hypothetical protein